MAVCIRMASGRSGRSQQAAPTMEKCCSMSFGRRSTSPCLPPRPRTLRAPLQGKVSSSDLHGQSPLGRFASQRPAQRAAAALAGGCVLAAAHRCTALFVSALSASAAGWRVWLSDYKQTLAAHVAADQSDGLSRLRASARMKTVSPKYVPREWMLVGMGARKPLCAAAMAV